MKRIGYILGARIRGSVDLGGTSTLTVPGAVSIGGTPIGAVTPNGLGVGGPVVFESTFRCQGRFILNNELACSLLTVGGNSILNGNLNVGGALGVQGVCTLNGIVNVSGPFTVGDPHEVQIYGLTRLANVAIYMQNLPTSDPGGSGRLWNNTNVMNISA